MMKTNQMAELKQKIPTFFLKYSELNDWYKTMKSQLVHCYADSTVVCNKLSSSNCYYFHISKCAKLQI